ncbi:MAG: ROK family protein [Enterocloster clostridioformis]
MVEETNQYSGLKGMNLEEHFRRLVPIPMTVGNDMNFLTMGCWVRSTLLQAPGQLSMGGNGIGGGMVIDGHLWTGASGCCSEVSFLPVYKQVQTAAAWSASRGENISEPICTPVGMP